MRKRACDEWRRLPAYIGPGVVGSGILASLLNIALGIWHRNHEAVEAQGGQSSWALFAVWPIALLGGSVVNLAYSIYLLTKQAPGQTFAVSRP